MTHKLLPWVLLYCLSVVPLSAFAEGTAEPPAAADAGSAAADGDAADAADAGSEPQPAANDLAFDPAAIGLPGLPLPMTSQDDFSRALMLIDERIAQLEAAVAETEAHAQEADAAADGASVYEELGADVRDGDTAAASPDTDPAAPPEASAETNDATDNSAAPEVPGPATTAHLEQQVETLKALRVTVQRRATLAERLGETVRELKNVREGLETIERDGLAAEPPYPVSLLDQTQAELASKQAVERVAETRLQTASRRKDDTEKPLSAAVRERRAARDRLRSAETDGAAEAERRDLAQALELARLTELLLRQELAAATNALELARTQDRTAEAEQALLKTRIEYLRSRVIFPQEALEQRLTELSEREETLRTQMDVLSTAGDRAEAALYRARRRLARADDDANRAALEAWVEARDTELRVARTGVDTLAGAIDHLAQMRTLLQQRHTLMNEPESMEQPRLLRQVIADTATARSAKNEIEERLSGLRSMQLAQARRLREADLSDELRSALTVRSDALERVEVYGRERLETQDALIALLEGMRCQLEAQLEEHNLSVQMMQAQEALQKWWDAELIVIDDQSIRVRELVSALTMFVLVVLLVSLVRMTARRALKRRKARDECIETGDVRLALSAIAGNTSHIFVLIAAFYVAMVFSGLASPTVREWLWTALVVAFYAQLGIWANAAMVGYFNRRRTRQEMRDPSMVTGYGVMMFFIRVGIWITVIVSLLAYFKYPIAGLVGALGVSSVAVAFAVQSILGDVFSSMAIVLDKPFRVGDFIKAGDTLGVKTTRIRSLSGEQVVMSNSDLLGSRIHNFKQQGINLGIHRRFEEAGISFAYPTQELILRRAAGPAHA